MPKPSTSCRNPLQVWRRSSISQNQTFHTSILPITINTADEGTTRLIASSQRRADFQHSCSRDQLLVRLPGLDPYLDPWSKRLSMELLPGIWVLPNSRVFSKQCGNLWDMRVFRVLLSFYAFNWFFIRVWNYSDVTFISSIADLPTVGGVKVRFFRQLCPRYLWAGKLGFSALRISLLVLIVGVMGSQSALSALSGAFF